MFWMSVLTDLTNRGVKDAFFLFCDGLEGLPGVVDNGWPLTTAQVGIIDVIRVRFRLASKKDWDALKRDVKPIYTSPNLYLSEPPRRPGRPGRSRREVGQESTARSSGSGGACGKSSSCFWVMTRRLRWVICSSNVVESLNACYRCVVRVRGYFRMEHAVLTCLCLVSRL